MVDAPYLRRFVHRVLLGPSALAPSQPHPPRRAVDGGVILLAGEPPGPEFRHVLVIGPEPPERVFALAAEFFGPPAVPAETLGFNVELEVESAPAVDAARRARGWRLVEEEPALALAPVSGVIPLPPPELDVRRVTDEVSLSHARALSHHGARQIPSLAAATAPGVALFVGYVDGRPVATSRVVCYGDARTPPGKVADVTGVVTAPEHRRQGYGTALTWATVAEAAAQGCSAVVLTATEIGYPVYRKMGFVPVSTYRTYAPPE